jgi:hemerythrin-like domain-containing protein
MCEHCGCREVPPIAELMDEHTALLDEATYVRKALVEGDPIRTMKMLRTLVGHLQQHVHREEEGVFPALRATGEFVEEVDELEVEHRDLDAMLAELDVHAPDFAHRVTDLLHFLDVHVERENLGVFPVSVVTLGADGWDRVARAHRETPTFLHEGPPS